MEKAKKKVKNSQIQSDTVPTFASPGQETISPDEVLLHPKNSMPKRVFFLSLEAIFNAIIIGFVAKVLIWLINLFTNLSFYGKFSISSANPSIEHVGWLVVFIPVIGGLIVGIMARYGDAGIRGHGLPEAIEQVLAHESRIPPILTFLKPLSAAIAIGTGGPFGAEGPVIATGAAFGSLAGQVIRVTANERKILLAAGASAGMTAIFGSPVAGVLMAIELLLFEFSPRSIAPVALSCATAAAMHILLFGKHPMFAMPYIPDPTNLSLCVYTIMGCVIGVIAAGIAQSVYLVEDLFKKTKLHWMWWPAIGAIAVGVIGYFAPRTMGVGYYNINDLLNGNTTLHVIIALFALKALSWSLSLGTGTSGGTLAPLFTIGGGLGALLGYLILHFIPEAHIDPATCALIGMAAMFAGASRALLTAIVFAFETTAQPHGLLPLLGACTSSYIVSFFLMKGGTLYTEKVKRMGIVTPESYEPDILQKVLVKDVIEEHVNVLSSDNTISDIKEWIKANESEEEFSTFVVTDKDEKLKGIIRRKNIFDNNKPASASIDTLIDKNMVYIYPENKLSLAVDIMDKYQIDVLPVVSQEDKKVIGILSHKNIFSVYRKRKNEDQIYERTISLKRRGIRIILKGRHLLGFGNEKSKSK
jgi:chloride channel protein, CIC family